MFRVLQDAKLNRQVFFDFNAIPQEELDDWLRRTGIVLPSDLLEFWRLTGGGDIFESETILRPTVPTPPNQSFVYDDIEGRNAAAEQEGKPADLYIFSIGGSCSAIRLSDQKYVTLKNNSYTVEETFDSFDEWYIRTLRAEFSESYRLPPIEEPRIG
jgi:hypothetical protein